MLYFSLILVASGIFFIIYTIFIIIKRNPGKSHSPKASVPAETPFANDSFNGNEAWNSEKKLDISLNAAADTKKEVRQSDLFKNMEKQVDNIDEQYKDEKMSDSFPVVMYEDSSKLIDYDKNDSVIDATLAEYKKIKRIGAGNIEILEDGINFRAGKKLFRFDFNRIANIKSGNNFFVLMIKGSDILKLFLFKKNTMLGARLKQVHNRYSSNVL